MYEVLISQLTLGISLKPIWYVYFGSFIFGRISPDLFNQEFINYMATQLHTDVNIIEFVSIILASIEKFELTYVFFNIIPSVIVSGKPPLFEIIVAQALDEDSKAVLPNGSSHLDGTTAISDLFKIFKVFL